MDEFLDTAEQWKLNQEEIKNLNRLITNETEMVMKNFPIKEAEVQMDSQQNPALLSKTNYN